MCAEGGCWHIRSYLESRRLLVCMDYGLMVVMKAFSCEIEDQKLGFGRFPC